MIDWDKTKNKFGYGQDDLAPTTQQHKVVWRCDNPKCEASPDKRERELVYNYARKKEEKAQKEGKACVCQKCSHSHRKGKIAERKGQKFLPLPPEINREKTYEMSKTLGGEPYYPESLSGWSQRPVVLTFEGEDYIIPRSNLNTLKSMKQFGVYRPVAWWTRKRRTGVVASKETKAQQKVSQQKRREQERVEKENLYQEKTEVISVDFFNKDKKKMA